MIKMNREQRVALKKKWCQNNEGRSYRQFRKSVKPGWDCVMVQWCGMWLGIEKNGYTHS